MSNEKWPLLFILTQYVWEVGPQNYPEFSEAHFLHMISFCCSPVTEATSRIMADPIWFFILAFSVFGPFSVESALYSSICLSHSYASTDDHKPVGFLIVGLTSWARTIGGGGEREDTWLHFLLFGCVWTVGRTTYSTTVCSNELSISRERGTDTLETNFYR